MKKLLLFSAVAIALAACGKKAAPLVAVDVNPAALTGVYLSECFEVKEKTGYARWTVTFEAPAQANGKGKYSEKLEKFSSADCKVSSLNAASTYSTLPEEYNLQNEVPSIGEKVREFSFSRTDAKTNASIGTTFSLVQLKSNGSNATVTFGAPETNRDGSSEATRYKVLGISPGYILSR